MSAARGALAAPAAPRSLRFAADDRVLVVEDVNALQFVRVDDGGWLEMRFA